MNKYLFISLIIFSCIFLTGCWSYREIDSLYIVAGIGVDKVPNSDQYNITAELINIKENQREQGFDPILLETKGDAVFDAIRKMVRISAKKPYWAHATTVIISEEVAREGLVPLLDLVATNEEPRLDMNIYVSKGKLANEILHMKSFSTDLRSYELATMINENKDLVNVPSLKIHEVINALATPKLNIVLPTVISFCNNGIDTNLLSEGAVFKMDKLVGFLNQEDVIPYLFIKNDIKSSVIDIKVDEKSPGGIATLETFNSKTKIKPIYGDKGISFDIEIKADVFLAELSTMTDYVYPPGRKKLKKLTEEYLENKIENHIKYVKEEFGFDIFGFGNIIRQRNPKLWKSLEEDWDTIFIDTDFNIKCDICIKNSGHTLKPIKVVD